MKFGSSWILAVALLAGACDDGSGPFEPLPADTAHGNNLLLPWSDVKGRIAYVTSNTLVLVDGVERKTKTLATPASNETWIDVALSSDAKTASVTSLLTDGTYRTTFFNTETGNITGAAQRATCWRWFNDNRPVNVLGDTIVYNGAHFTVVTGMTACPAWDTNGRFLIVPRVVNGVSSLWRVEFPSAVTTKLIDAPVGRQFFDPAVSATNTIAVIVAGGTAANDVWLLNTDGTNPRPVASWPGLFGLSWNHDGDKLAGVSTLSTNNFLYAGLLIVKVSDGSVQKLVAPPVYAAWWGDGLP